MAKKKQNARAKAVSTVLTKSSDIDDQIVISPYSTPYDDYWLFETEDIQGGTNKFNLKRPITDVGYGPGDTITHLSSSLTIDQSDYIVYNGKTYYQLQSPFSHQVNNGA